MRGDEGKGGNWTKFVEKPTPCFAHYASDCRAAADLFETDLTTLQCLGHESLVKYNQLLSGSSASTVSDAAVLTKVLDGRQEYQLQSDTHSIHASAPSSRQKRRK